MEVDIGGAGIVAQQSEKNVGGRKDEVLGGEE